MILDALTRVASAQAATTGATSVSASSIDLGDVTPKRRIGDGEPMALVVDVDSITAAADTFTIDAISATNEALTAGVIVMVTTGVKAAAALPAGTLVVLPIPPGQPTQRYIGARTTLGAADALTYSAYYLPLSFIHKLQTYAKNYLV
jgi:hypothetical protein